MAPLASIVNWALAFLLWLLLLRLLIQNWGRGGAVLLPVLSFFFLLRYDVIVAGVAVVLMLLFVPTIASSPLGVGLMRLLVALTDPAIELVRRGSGGRAAGGPAIVVAALLVLALRVASFLVLHS